ncbi:MAG: Ig-like domain-containing protein, partial [Coprobacillaceae bacterium]
MKRIKSIVVTFVLITVMVLSNVVKLPVIGAEDNTKNSDATIYMDSDTIITDNFEGFGVQWDPSDLYDYTDEQWDSFVEKASFLKPNMMRIMIHDADSYCIGFENEQPIYDWNSIFMQRFYKIMDFAEENNIPVMIGEWVGPKNRGILTYDEFGKTVGWDSPVWASMIVDVLEHLIEEKGYTCIRYYNMINEPNHKGNTTEIYEYWNRGIANLRGLMDASDNVKIRDIQIVGPDVYTNWRGWLDQTTAEENRDNIGVNEIHWYVPATDVYNGKVETELKSLQEYTYAKDPTAKEKGFGLGEAGVAIGGAPNAGDQQLRTRYYQYGVEMFDLGLQSMRAGLKFTSAWGFEDSMHIHAKDVVTDFSNTYGPNASTEAGRNYVPNTPTGDVTIDNKLKVWGFWNELADEIVTQNEEAGKPGLYNIERSDEELRPWYYTWSMMCRYFPEGSKVMYTTESHVDRLRATSAIIPSSNNKNDISMAVVNSSSQERTVTLNIPNVDEVTDLNQYFYYDGEINGETRALNEKGQLLPHGTIDDVNLSEGVTVTLPGNSCMILTTLGYEGENNPIQFTTGEIPVATGVKVNVESNLQQLTVGNTYQMESELIPSFAKDEIEWSVSDYFGNETDKATIDEDGKITIEKPGNIRIIGSLKSNPDISSSVTIVATKTGVLNEELKSIEADGVAKSYEGLTYDTSPSNFGGATTVKRLDSTVNGTPGIITYKADGIKRATFKAFSLKENLMESGNFVVEVSIDENTWVPVTFETTKTKLGSNWYAYEVTSNNIDSDVEYQYLRVTLKSTGDYKGYDPQYGGGQIFFGEEMATNIVINNKDKYIGINQTMQFTGVVEPASFSQDIKWEVLSEDGKQTDIASIDESGVLTAHKAGNVMVVATTSDDGLSAYYPLTIVEGYFVDDIDDFSKMYQYGNFIYEASSTKFNDQTLIKRSFDKPESIVYALSNIKQATFEVYRNGNLDTSSVDIYISKDGLHYERINKTIVDAGKAASGSEYTLYEVSASIPDDEFHYIKLEVKNDSQKYTPMIGKASIIYTPEEEPEITGLTIDESLMKMNIGDQKQVNIKTAPSYASPDITWNSSDEEVATVDENGVVTAKEIGDATIYAKYNDEIYAQCVVNIYGDNLALNKDANATSNSGTGYLAEYVNDGDYNTRWGSKHGTTVKESVT